MSLYVNEFPKGVYVSKPGNLQFYRGHYQVQHFLLLMHAKVVFNLKSVVWHEKLCIIITVIMLRKTIPRTWRKKFIHDLTLVEALLGQTNEVTCLTHNL